MERDDFEHLVAEARRHFEAGRAGDAAALLERAARLRPDDAEVFSATGVALVRAGRAAEALPSLRRLTELRSDDPAAFHQFGDAAALAGELAEAEASLRRCVELDPRRAGAWARLGNVLRSRQEPERAGEAFERAAALDPSPDVLSNLADAYIAAARPDDAIPPLERALQADANHVIARVNLGCARMRQDRVDDAIADFQAVLARRADLAEAHYYLALALLKKGELARGWKEFEWRFALDPDTRAAQIRRRLPQWTGEPLSGKTILLYAEQGFGDTIQFARFIPMLAGRGAGRIIVAARPPLHRLLRGVRGVSDVVDLDAADLPPADVYFPLMSLPLALGSATIESIPAAMPYVSAAPELMEQWRGKLAGAPGLKVGLAWAGSRTNSHDRYRSCPLDQLAPILQLAGPAVTFFSLQKGDGSEQLRDSPHLAAAVTDRTDELHDWAETAAMIANLDLVISVDTGIAHLAAAMGRPTWTMLSTCADWRYLQSPHRTAWYPTMWLFRQQTLHDWTGVAERVASELRQQVARRGG